MYWSQYNTDRGPVQISQETRNGEPDEDGVHIRAVMDALRRIVRALRISARAVEARLGINSAQVFVLHQLKKQDASSIDELAERTLTHQSSVSAVVGRLAGLVKVVDEALLRSLGWWTIFVGNLLAATAMLAYFRARHPSLGTRVRAQWALEHRPHQPHEG